MMKPEYTAHLTPWEYKVIAEKATDPPGEGGYTNHFEPGTYHCRACGAPLFESSAKFHSGCGWPAFDREIPGAIMRKPDFSYGMVRTEILCMHCGGHLGHVFEGEGFTPTNTRHCVNSSSIVFHPTDKQELVIGVPDFHHCQEFASRIEGVLSVECGFAGDGAHLFEALRIEYDPHQTSPVRIISTLVERTTQDLRRSDYWHCFVRDGSQTPEIPPNVSSGPLLRYTPASEEHQWFLRKAGIVRTQK
ncbi:MAG: peptide-methionine (R)-S-oxide reductase MsrB [Chlorobi bacterium]|nr:peptide-methionine (R)-S-oxide reductase MsrB [Chlorobiota bacterium]